LITTDDGVIMMPRIVVRHPTTSVTTDDENACYAEPKIRGKNMNATLNSDAIKILRCLSRSPKRRKRGETLHRSPSARR
jgi:hypothetical protein